ncbi:lytic murein transglycosylase [Thalassococcus sp. S3]|nr:lytic murein transglycosylase [Thalassococcus sp. S3]
MCGLALVGLLADPVTANGPKPFPEFEAKRIKPPKPGQRSRITVQIDPEEQVASPDAEAEPQDAPSPRAGTPGRYAWFWERVSPDLAATGPGRLDEALQTIKGQGAGVPTPRLQHLQDIAKARGVPILRSTIGTQVSPALVLAVISVESAGRTDAVSSAGASGLMQLMPDTAARFGVTDSFSVEENIAGGVKYLDWLMTEFNRDPILVLAGYNAGEGSVHKHAGVPPFSETRDYVPKVLAAFQVAKGLCKTPPELITDGCAFAAMK